MPTRHRDPLHLIAGLIAVALVTLTYVRWLHVANPATVSTTFLLVILILASTARLWVAVATSIAAMLAFNFFFLPPVGTFTIADPQNWVALVAFLAVSLVASNLSAAVQAREREAVLRRDELARLFDLSRDVLLTSDSGSGVAALAHAMRRRFDLEYVAIALPTTTSWQVQSAGPAEIALDETQLWSAFAASQRSIEFDAHSRAYAGHQKIVVGDRAIDLVPLRSSTTPIGLLAAYGRPIEAGTLDAIAGIAAIAIERAQLLEERKDAEMTKQSEQLKAALLASVGHDLRTPLTAIRLAASNVRQPGLSDEQRQDQANLILEETERLTRLFQNILEMARLEAGAVIPETRWTHVSEIVDAARAQVENLLRGHPLNVSVAVDVPVRIDPRPAATALAHILENAAQYAPAGSPIEVTATVADTGLSLQVRDHGAGIAPGDAVHLFERFYRGETAKARTSGTGMGLWIARGLLAVLGGRIWAQNAPDGGAVFTMVVPVSTQAAAPQEAAS